MPFGQFRGLPIGDLPDDYLDWLMTLDDLREPLRSGVEREWRARHADSVGLEPDIANVATEIVTAGYRALAKQHHPDVGGDAEAMRRLNEAVAALRAFIEHATVAEFVA